MTHIIGTGRTPDGDRSPADTSDDPVASLVRVVRAGHVGDPGPVRAALDAPDDEVRSVACGALVRLGGSGHVTMEEVEQRLVHVMGDRSSLVRRRVALESARWAAIRASLSSEGASPETTLGADLVTSLLTLLDDEDFRVVETAAFAFGEVLSTITARPPGIGEVAVARLGQVATGHEEHLCREAAVAALGSIGDPAGLPAVIAGCRDRASVRRRAVLALAAFDHPDATVELERLVGDRDLQVSQSADELLAIERGEAT